MLVTCSHLWCTLQSALVVCDGVSQEVHILSGIICILLLCLVLKLSFKVHKGKCQKSGCLFCNLQDLYVFLKMYHFRILFLWHVYYAVKTSFVSSCI